MTYPITPRPSRPNAPANTAAGAARSAADVRRWLHERGITLGQWASENDFPAALVYAVASGRRKCLRGESHRIALALGMKVVRRNE